MQALFDDQEKNIGKINVMRKNVIVPSCYKKLIDIIFEMQ
jgi:hypothetical protein